MHKRKKKKNLIKLSLITGGIFIFLLTGFALIFIAALIRDLPKADDLVSKRVNQSTKIYDRTGAILLYEVHGEEKRTIIPYEDIPAVVKNATIAIEDQNFYNHPAFDWRAIIRAVIQDILRLRVEQGASTITQQLAKNAYLTNEKTITRKVKELLLALKLEKQFSKDEILNLYLNQIPYGENAYGIEAAAKTYFNKSAKDLNMAEAALLAALPQATTYYSPWGLHKDELLTRKDLVLKKMYELNYITEEQLEGAKGAEYEFAPQATTIKAPHFIMAVQDYLVKKYGAETLEKGGLNVITTLDWELQQVAETAVWNGVTRNTELYKGENGALLAADPKTGQVLAVVGSKDYFDESNEGNFNVAMQGLRQPGSAFKPFAYVTAFKKGFTPETILFDLETEFDATGIPEKSYKPGNFDEYFRGPVSLRTALAQSINIPAVKIMYLAGIDNVLNTARDFGIKTLTERSRYGLSLVLGGGEVKLSELVNAYAVFANDGIYHDQTLILKITDAKGETLEEFSSEAGEEVIDPEYARTINDILSDVSARSGLFGASLNLTVFSGYQVALKTGTTDNYVDAWAIGYTPGIVVGVWAGNNHREPLQKKGGSILAAVPIWSEFVNEALKKQPVEFFVRPAPYAAEKPILRGDYLYGKQIHNILYYVQKNDPQGPMPVRPESDPQFLNWELPVLAWAERNLPDFAEYNKSWGVDFDLSDISIDVRSPLSGEFIKNNTVNLSFSVNSSHKLNYVETYFNNEMLEKIQAANSPLVYQKNILINNAQTQNLLRIKAVAEGGKTKEKEIILFK
ncbi:MAG: PBP1A family penicillin-binding protein [Candidatus Liptonbacteria bacterium]|nr:PBP1A family penicillin-binding protein [Candidatus Liptonbacteria bacterium]